MNNVLKKHGDSIKKQGTKIKQHVQTTTQAFVAKHPDEIAKAQQQVEKGITKFNLSTTAFQLPTISAPAPAPASASTTTATPHPKSVVEEVESSQSIHSAATALAASAASSSLEKDYVSVELEPETEELDEISQQEREEQTVQVKEEEETSMTTTTMPTHNSDEEAQPMISTMEESALFEYPTRLSDTVAAVNAKHEENEENEKKDDDDDNSAGGGASDADVDGSGSGSDSEDWEDSGDEAWPVSNTRYAPVGDYQSRVSNPKGSTRLATEFTLGAGFHHLNVAGAKHMFGLDHNAGTILPCDRDQKLVQYNEAALELMKANKLQGKGLKVSKSAYLDKVLLITDAPHAIRLYIGDEDGLCIVGMALIRDDIIFTSGILNEDVQKPLTLQLDGDGPVLESIEIQCCTFLEGGGGRVEKKISYIMLRGNGETIMFGQVHEEGFDGKSSIYSEVESATGNLCIAGIGYFDNKPISLQVVDLGADCDDVVDAMDTCVYYNNGVISGNLIRSRMKEVEFLNSITTENDAVWDVLEGCMDAVENSSPSYGELLPNAINLFETALNGNVDTIHSVMRLDRYLTHVIQEKKTIDTFDNDNLNFYAKLIPMKQMWGIFSNTIERIKRITNTQPELNSFNVAFLQGTDEFFMQAFFIFLTQAALLILTISHIWIHRSEAFHIPSPLRFVVSICGTIVVNFMAKQSKNNFEDFETIFPEYIGTTMYKLDAFSNIVGGKLVTLSTLVLLMMTDDNLDIVLNATALLFVLELDECLVDSNPIWVTGVYRGYFMKDVLKELQTSDSRYWNPDYLRKDRGQHYRLHLPSCSLLFPQEK